MAARCPRARSGARLQARTRALRGDPAAQQASRNVISSRLFAGRTVIHVLSDTNPGDGFERAQSGLEDVYLATVNASRRAA